MDIEIINFSSSCIHGQTLQRDTCPHKWFITSVYGQLEVEKRMETWDLIRTLCIREKPWLILEHINKILSLDEKWDGTIVFVSV